MKTYLISIGDELLIGQTTNTNATYIGSQLIKEGYKLNGEITVGDRREDILQAYRYFAQDADLIITTGGLGPTKDDLTKHVLAELTGAHLVFKEQLYSNIVKQFERRNIPITQANREQCFLPHNTTLLDNRWGTAPGMWWPEQRPRLVALPGVPYEMKGLLDNEVLPRIKELWPPTTATRTLMTSGAGETILADLLHDFENNLPLQATLAYLPDLMRVRLRLTVQHTSWAEAETLVTTLSRQMENLVHPYVYGYDDEPLPLAIGKLLLNKGLSIATAESCTGGYLSHLITSIPGASRYYSGSIVAYQNDLKKRLLGVDEQILAEYGAVSEETVQAMCRGLLKVIPADLAVAISGIAGPEGGTPDKPVGTICLAVANQEKIVSKRVLFNKNRDINIQYAAYYALNMVLKFLQAE